MKRKLFKVFMVTFLVTAAVIGVIKYRSYRQTKLAQQQAEQQRQEQQRIDQAKAAEAARLAAIEAQRRHIKVLVTPFENGAAAQSLSALSLGIPAHIAERLEDDPYIEPLNGPLVLTDQQAQLVTPKGKEFDLAKANQLAIARGATHFLTGRFYGQVWTWTFEAMLYKSAPTGPILVGSGKSFGDLTDLVPTASGKMVRTNSAANIFTLLGKAVDGAFAQATFPLEPPTSKAVATPPTPDAFAFLKLARAYVRYFANVSEDGVDDTAIGLAKVAAIIDPKQSEAQRLYAALLLADEQVKLARIHYEFAIEARPRDVRSLVQLGKLELDADNADIAAGYLKRATEVRPNDGDNFYWYATAQLKLGKTDEAIFSLEKARTLQWWHAPARKELANQYARRHRYREAAAELDVVANRILTNDPEPVYLEAACLRAADDRNAAGLVLWQAKDRFPGESRMWKFRGDLFMHDGDVERAMQEYRVAYSKAPNDARLKAILYGTPGSAVPLGGDTLLQTIGSATNDSATVETSRSGYQKAVNDAIADLHYNAEKACVDGGASSSALLAQQLGQQHQDVGTRFVNASARISRALKDGEGSALTPDEATAADKVMTASAKSQIDSREMRGQYMGVFVPLYRRFKCETYDGPLKANTVEDIDRRNLDRQVTLPPVPVPPTLMSFTPQLDVEEGRVIRFIVDNKDGTKEQVLTLDDKELGTVLPGRQLTFSTEFGYHRLCLLPKGSKCGDDATLRVPFIHDGWTIRVRNLKQPAK